MSSKMFLEPFASHWKPTDVFCLPNELLASGHVFGNHVSVCYDLTASASSILGQNKYIS